MDKPLNILVIRFSSIGDIVLTGPVIKSLRKALPDSKLDFLTKAGFAEILSSNPNIDEVLTLQPPEGLVELGKAVKEVINRHYDLVIDLHSNVRSHIVSGFSGANIIRPDIKLLLKRSALVHLGVDRFEHVEPIAERYFKGLEGYGLSWNGSVAAPWIYVSEEALEKARNITSNLAGKALISVAPSAKWTTKIWPTERFGEVLTSICAERKDAHVLVLGAKEDSEICSKLAALLGEDCTDLSGKISIMEAAAIINQSKALLCNDSGMMHIAEGLDIPLVAIFGCTTRELGYFPVSRGSKAVEVPLACRPCTKNGRKKCPLGHMQCLNNISADKVYRALSEVLEGEMRDD